MTFDEKAKSWDTEERIKRAEKTAEYLIAKFNIDNSKELFELGSGTGILAIILAETAGRITVSDSSKGMLEELNKKLEICSIKNIETLYFDIEKEEGLADRYDLIYSSMVLHHIEDIGNTAKKMYNMLKLNGKVAMIDLFKEDGTFHKDNSGIKHFGFSKEEITGYFEKAGFKNIEVIEFERMDRITEDGNKKEYPIFLLSAEK